MAKKKVGVTIETELHADVKSAAPKRGMNVETAYDQALRQWLSAGKATQTPKFMSGLSPTQTSVVRDVADLLMSQPALEAFMRRSIDSFRQLSKELKK